MEPMIGAERLLINIISILFHDIVEHTIIPSSIMLRHSNYIV